MRGIGLKVASLILLLAPSAPAATAGAARAPDSAALEAEIAAAIAGWTSEPDAAAQAEWQSEVRAVIRLWTGLRDQSCDPGPIALARGPSPTGAGLEGERCRAAFDRLMAEDLRWRYDIAGSSAPRPALDPAADARPFRPHHPEAIDCVPPAEPECDYCAINACWAERLAQDERDLAAVEAVAIEAARRQAVDRSRRGGVDRLVRAQQSWKALRDADCRLQNWETPNRWGRANYAMIEAPCLHAETRARIEWLAANWPEARAAFPARIPDAYRGLWSAADLPCSQAADAAEPASDALVRISGGGIAFAASFARVASGLVEQGAFRFVADTQEEGETGREEIRMRLDRDRLVLSRDGDRQSLVRCDSTDAG